MLKQDFLTGKIKNAIKTMLKLLFDIDDENVSVDLLNNEEDKRKLKVLLDKIDKGELNDAENELFDLISMENTDNKENLKMGIIFYSYLCNKNDKFLEKNNYTRTEIQQGLKDLMVEFNLQGMEDVFFINI